MRYLQRATLFLFVCIVPAAAFGSVSVQNLRLWQAPDNTRLVFDLSGPVEHRLTETRNPDRIVIEIDGARLQDGLTPLDVSHSYISAVRAAEHGTARLRITLDLRRPVRPRSFVLKPAGQYGHRLVIDLFDEAVAESSPEPEPRAALPAKPVLKPSDLIVAIDAGHGGEDPGALGKRYRTREKDVVLAIARELYKLVAATPGMKPVMIRDGDYYVGLRERIRKAQRQNADVFISIHADSVAGRQASGSSVYALSLRGATNEQAKVLADKENAADLVGGADFNEKDDLLLKVLVDMTQSATIGDGLSLGTDVLASLRPVGPIHYDHVQQAGFVVLKSPKIPSILVETAYISNPAEEAKLRDKGFQRRMAEGIFAGLKRAAPRLLMRRGAGTESLQAAAPPPLAPLAPPPVPATQTAHAALHQGMREHVVRSGETLSQISRQYDIHVDALRFLNNLRDDDLSVGTRLRIPARAGDP
ncbi:MAG: N-acetylmuramoyl-L-alanine amidase [Gammaproteobacteria bacterium]|nr:N-acetylmuramoyl-L-alanine amidase [Gammaproteobacteria bacterium]